MKNELKMDTRKSPENIYAVRMLIVRMHKKGLGPMAIREHFGIDMPVRTVGEYLRRWGFTPQKPIKVAYEQKPEAVKEWLETKYPAISRRAKEENAEIH